MICRLLARLHIFPTFHQSLIAAYAVSSGHYAYYQPNYKRAFLIYKEAADFEISCPSVASCQYMVGMLYQHGDGVEVDYSKAEFYFKKAISLGNSDAEKALSTLTKHIKATSPNDAK